MSDFSYRPQIEVLFTADGVRRQHKSEEDKIRIVEESFVGHRQYRDVEIGTTRSASFAPVSVTDDRAVWRPGPVDSVESAGGTQVEIVLPNGRRFIVPVVPINAAPTFLPLVIDSSADPAAAAEPGNTGMISVEICGGSGIVMICKRLEQGGFARPKVGDGVMRLSRVQFEALFAGLDWCRIHAPRPTSPTGTEWLISSCKYGQS